MKRIMSAAIILMAVSIVLSEEEYGKKLQTTTIGDPNDSNKTITKEKCVPSDNVCDKCDQSLADQHNAANGSAGLDCVHIKIPVGRKSPDSMLNPGYLMLFSYKPNASMYTPQALKYIKDYAIDGLYNGVGNGTYGQINMTDPYGSTIRFDFSSNSCVGVPMGGQYYSSLRLEMVDAEGWSTTNNPAYYDLYNKQGDLYRFCASTSSVNYLDLVLRRDVSGRQEQYSDRGYEVIKDSSGVLRQIKTTTHLADIVVQTNTSYRVDLYRISQLQAGTDTNGFYAPLRDEEPYTSWFFENPGTIVKDLTVRSVVKFDSIKSTNTYNFVYTDSANQWELIYAGTGVSKTKSEEWSDDRCQMLVTVTRNGNNGELASKEQRLYHMYLWGGAIMSETIGTGTVSLVTTHSYYTSQSETGKYGQVKEKIMPNGAWYSYDYDAMGRIKEEKRSWKDSPLGSAASNSIAVIYDYSSLTAGDAILFNDQRPRTVTEKILGVTVSKTYHAYVTNSVRELQMIEEKCSSPTVGFGDVSNLRTTKTYFGTNVANHLIGRLKSVEYPDGRLDTYSYEYGTLPVTWTNAAEYAFTPDPDGEAWRETVTHGTTTNPDGIAGKTTREIKVLDGYSEEVLKETYVCSGGANYERIAWTVQTFNDFYKPIATCRSDGTLEEAMWAACGCAKQSETDASGIKKSYGLDLLNRVTSIKKEGVNSPNDDLKTQFTYDAANRRLTEAIVAGPESNSIYMLISSNEYDVLGRMASSVDSLGLTTSYGYQNAGRTFSIIHAGGRTNITENYLDGRIRSVCENGAIRRYADYGVNPNNTQYTITYTGPQGAASPVWLKTTTDMLGRTIRKERPGFGETVLTNQYVYNSKNQLILTTNNQQPGTITEYNELGSRSRSGLDSNNNGILDSASMDRINESEDFYEKNGTDWFKVSVSKLYAQDNSATITTNSIQKTKLTGLEVGGVVSFVVSSDILGNQTTSSTMIDRGNKKVTQTVTYPDSTNSAVSSSINGLLVSLTGKTGIKTDFGYDLLERRTSVTDPRTGTSITHYNSKGQVDYVEDAASNRTRYVYSPDAGRQIAVSNALGQVVRYEYSLRGQLIKTWGDTVYPVSYGFDDFDRMISMTTYRNGIGWSGATWPADTGTGDTTTWLYDQATGLLTNKLYADGKGLAYSYTADGRIQKRTWARLSASNQPLTTLYSYSTSGELLAIDYSDTTPDVTLTYDRGGRQRIITDGHGERFFTYNSALQLVSETNALGQIYRIYDNLGRSAGFNYNSDYCVNYGYDTLGRFSSVSSSVPFVASYSYLDNSDLLAGHAIQVAGFTSQVSRTYEPNRNLITQVKNTSGANLISQFDYTNDQLGKRTQRIDNSTLTNSFGYNTRSELISAFMDTNNFSYLYDNIGNRQSASSAQSAESYTANSLNQYTSITNGGLKTLSYDDDGNLTQSVTLSNDRVTTNQYAWDCENRLISVSSNGTAIAYYKYDYMGRRYEKVVNSVTNKFVYVGWAMIQEQGLSGVKSYAYGLDLSGTLEGAGTIGGLLVANLNGTNAFFCFDANGNVTDLVGSDGNPSAHYEFDPYGNTTLKTGVLADANPYRFSKKYTDDETDLVYYGLRFFSPKLGRWCGRDPLEEKGGHNLYSFCVNLPISQIDPLGLVMFHMTPDPIAGCPFSYGDLVHGKPSALGKTDCSIDLQPACVCDYYGNPKKYKMEWKIYLSCAITLEREHWQTDPTYKYDQYPFFPLPTLVIASRDQIYGHEQLHIFSMKVEVESAIVDVAAMLEGLRFDTINACEDRMKNEKAYFKKSCDDIDAQEAGHNNDFSPPKYFPLPPFDGVPPPPPS